MQEYVTICLEDYGTLWKEGEECTYLALEEVHA